mgnify:CR=1 FL=1
MWQQAYGKWVEVDGKRADICIHVQQCCCQINTFNPWIAKLRNLIDCIRIQGGAVIDSIVNCLLTGDAYLSKTADCQHVINSLLRGIETHHSCTNLHRIQLKFWQGEFQSHFTILKKYSAVSYWHCLMIVTFWKHSSFCQSICGNVLSPPVECRVLICVDPYKGYFTTDEGCHVVLIVVWLFTLFWLWNILNY